MIFISLFSEIFHGSFKSAEKNLNKIKSYDLFKLMKTNQIWKKYLYYGNNIV
jgi:hypothetical protein